MLSDSSKPENKAGYARQPLLNLKKHLEHFCAHLFGLDLEQSATQTATTNAAAPRPQTINWLSALQGLKLSNIMQGINITTNFLYLVLFLAMIFWLFVIYWIRHHDPFAKQVLGTGAAQSATAADDRVLVDGMKDALPFHTSSETGQIYLPNKPEPQNNQPNYVLPGNIPSYYPSYRGGTYMLSVPAEGGRRIKTIVNR